MNAATVLVIEEDPHLLDGVREILELDEYHVLTAGNGGDGLELTLEYLPDVIICDVMMPVMNGYEVLEAIRNTPQTQYIPLIFFSAKGGADIERAKEAGVDGYIVKPFAADDLLDMVAAFLSDD